MRGAPRGGRGLGLRTGTALGVLGGIAIGLCLVAPVVAEPRGAYEELIQAPLRRLLAPCLLMAEQCQARGEHEATCRPRVERCIRDIEEQAKEQALREMEKEDPGARRTMEAIESLEAPIVRVAGYDTPFPFTLEHTYLPDAKRVFAALEHVMSY